MNKLLLASTLLFSLSAGADNTPVFNFSKGILNLPYVTTSKGPYYAKLQIDTSLPATTFRFLEIGPAAPSNDLADIPSFDFNTGVLSVPVIRSSEGAFTGSLQLSADQRFLKVTNVQPTIPPGVSKLGTCTLFPQNNVWNTPIDSLPVHQFSSAWINSISTNGLHSDFGEQNGQPFNAVIGSTTPKYTFNFQIPAESDTGPYPIPNNYVYEINTGDNRLFIIDYEVCKLYELYNAQQSAGQWSARRGAIWDLTSNALRPQGWGSADEAGLPTVPGLILYDEVQAGVIKHALRFSYPRPSSSIWPARHAFGPNVAVNTTLPMGARLRLKANVDISKFAPELQVMFKAMKTYGIILADTGGALFLSGDRNSLWSDNMLSRLGSIKGSDFEAVDTQCMIVDPNSGKANLEQCN